MRGYKVRGLNPSALDTAQFDESNYEPYSYTVRGHQPPKYEEIKRNVLLSSRYDKNLSPYEVQEYNRAQNQGWLNKVGSGLISRGSSIVPKIGQGIGHVGGFVYEAANAYASAKTGDIQSAMDISGIWDNFVVDIMSKADDKLREELPVFGSEKYYEGNILQQMGTTKFWADDFFDAIAFAASAYAPGALAGAAGKALGLAGNSLKAFQLGSSTIYNTISESGFEAHDFGKQAREQYSREKFGLPFEELNDEQQFETKLKIAPKQATTFMANAAILGIPNYIQSKFFHGGFSQNAQKLRRAVTAGEISLADVNVFRSAQKSLFGGIASEGLWEEGMQNAVQRYQQRSVDGKAYEGFYKGVANEWLDGFYTTEGQKGMILGALIGGPMGFRSGYLESMGLRKGITEVEQFLENRMSALDHYDKIFADPIKKLYKTNNVQKTRIIDGEETAVKEESYVDKDGNMEIDPLAANKLLFRTLYDKFLYDEAMVANLEGDEAHLKMVNDEALARRFFAYATLHTPSGEPVFEDVDEAIAALKERELQFPEDFAPEGLKKKNTETELTKLKEIYEKVENDLLSIKDFEKDDMRKGFKNVVRKTLFGETVKLESLKSMRGLVKNEKAIEELDILIGDSQSLINDLSKETTRDKLFEQYKKEVFYLNDQQQKLRELESAETRDEEAIKDVQFDIEENKYIQGKYYPNFSFAYDVAPDKLIGDLGARNQYYFNIGMDAMVDATVDSMLEDVEKGEGNIADVLNYITDTRQGRSRIRKEDVDKVQASLISEGERVTQLIDQAAESQEYLDANPEIIPVLKDGFPEDTPNPNYNPEETQLHQEVVDEAKLRASQLDAANSKYDELVATVEPKTERKRFSGRQEEERFFRRKFGDKAVKASKGISDAYNANENAYSSIADVRGVIKQLKEIKRAYGKDPRKQLLETKEFKGFMDSVNQALEDLKAIEKKVEENFANRAAKDQRSKENNDSATFLSIGVRVDKQSKTFTIADPDIYNSILNAVGKTFFNKVMGDAKKSERPFDGIYAEKIIDKIKEQKKTKDVLAVIKGTEENKGKRTAAIDEQITRIKQTKFYKERSESIHWPFKSYRQNPFKLFDLLIHQIAPPFIKTGDQVVPLDTYRKDKDAIALYDAIRSGAPIGYEGIERDDLLSILEQQINVQSIIRLQDNLESSNRLIDQIETEIAIIKNKKQAPSNQQIISVRQGVMVLGKKFTDAKKKYGTWLYLKGLSGTGKTSFFSRWLTGSLGLKRNEYIAVAHHPKAMDKLQKSIMPEKPAILATAFTKNDIDDNVRLVVLDEVGRLSASELGHVADVVMAVNQGRDKPVYLMAIGDPTQISDRDALRPVIADPGESKSRIQELDPLTSIFRTSSSAILFVTDVFQDNFKPVTTLVTKATDIIGKPADGVHVSSISEDLKKQLDVHRDNNRSKIIIVTNEVAQKRYEEEYGTIAEVLMWHEISGIEYDEVYIDIDPKTFEFVKKYNEAAYTAVGRAKQYVFFRDYTGNFEYSVSDDMKIEESEEDIDARMLAQYNERLEFESDVLKDMMPKAKARTFETRSITKQDVEDLQEPQVESREDYTDEPETPVQSPEDAGEWLDIKLDEIENHDPQYTSHGPITHYGISGELRDSRVKVGSKVKYIKVRNEEKDRYEIHAVGQELHNDGTPVKGNVWHRIAVLGEEELHNTSLGQYLSRLSDEATDSDGRHLSTGLSRGTVGKFTTEEEGPFILATGTVTKARPLQYDYNPAFEDKGLGMLERLMDKVNKAFSYRQKENLSYTVKIYKNGDLLPNNVLVQNSKIKAGVPYLEIERKTTKDGKEKTSKFQWVRLNPRKLRQNDKDIGNLQEFLDAIKVIEKEVGIVYGTPEVNELLRRFKRNYTVQENEIVPRKPSYTWDQFKKDREQGYLVELTEDKFNSLSKLVDPIIRLYYGPSDDVEQRFTTEEEMWGAVGVENKDNPDEIYEFVELPGRGEGRVKIVDRKDDQKFTYLHGPGLKELHGQAQTTLDYLARANGSVAGYNFRTRRVWRKGGKGKRNFYYTGAKSLLASETTLGKYFDEIKGILDQVTEDFEKEGEEFHYSALLKDKDNHYLTDDANMKVIEDFLVRAGYLSQVDIDQMRVEHTTPVINTAELEAVLGFDKEGNHPSLYKPLDYKEFNDLGEDVNGNRQQLDDLLVNNLKEILPTKINIKLDIAREERKEGVYTKAKKTVKSAEDKLRDIRKRRLTGAPMEELGKKITQEEARRLAQEIMPDIKEEELKFVTRSQMMLIAGQMDAGHYLNGILYIQRNEDDTVHKNVIRHEVFHKVFNEFLTPVEQRRLTNAFRKEFPEFKDKDFYEIEEALAKNYQLWKDEKLKVKDGILLKFYNWLSRVFGFVNGNVDNIKRFYKTVESGYFTDVKGSAIGIRRGMKEINRKYGDSTILNYRQSLKVYMDARSIIKGTFATLLQEGFSGYPVSRRELKSIASNLIEADLNENQTIYNELDKDKNPGEAAAFTELINAQKKTLENYDELLEDVYPSWNFDGSGEILVDTNLTTEEIVQNYIDEREKVNINDHTRESDEVNNETKLSDVVKDFLSNVPIDKGYMEWREAYIRTLQLMEGGQPYADNWDQQLLQAWGELGENPRSKVVVDHIIEVINRAKKTTNENGAQLPDTMKFLDEDTFVHHTESVKSIAGPVGSRVEGAQVLKRGTGQSTRGWLLELETEFNISPKDTKALFIKHQNENVVRSLVNNMVSQKKKNLYIAERKNEFGLWEMAYIPAKTLGPRDGLSSFIIDGLDERFPDQDSIKKFIRNWINPRVDEHLAKKEFVREFLLYLGAGHLAATIPDYNVGVIYTDIIEFFKEDAKIVGQVKERITDEDNPEEQEEIVYYDIHDALKNKTSMVNRMADLLNVGAQFIRATNTRDVSGKRKYMHSLGSQAHDTIFNFSNNREYKTGNMSLTKLPHTETEFFGDNIFVSGLNKIHTIVDHDGIRNIQPSGKTTGILYKREDKKNFISRSFVFGFLDRVRHSVKEKERYFQFVYPNGRKNAMGAEVNVLTPQQVKQGLAAMVKQIGKRNQDLEGTLENFKIDKLTNFDLLQEVIGDRDLRANPIKDSEVEGLVNKVYAKFMSLAEQFTDDIITEKTELPVDLSSYYKLSRFVDKDLFPEWRRKDLITDNGKTRVLEKEAMFNVRPGQFKYEGRLYQVSKEALLPLAFAFVANSYVNSYNFNQLLVGDFAQFQNSTDVIRRLDLASAPGYKPFTNSLMGMPEKFRMGVIQDPIRDTDDIGAMLSELLTDKEKESLPDLLAMFEKDFSPGDGQGFMLPERFEQLQYTGFGDSYQLAHIMKPVIYDINEEGVERGVKYSSIVLSDQLLETFPSLGVLRTNMRRGKMGEVVFNSAVKVGNPQKSVLLSHEDLLRDPEYEINEGAVFEISNINYKIQNNPRAKIDSDVTQPSQLIYLLNILDANKSSADAVYKAFAEIIRTGNEKFAENTENESSIRQKLIDILGGVPGNEREHEMLTAGLSLNFPALSDKAIIHLASHLKKNTVDLRFSGTKLVLQSAYGARKYAKGVLDEKAEKLRYRLDSKGGLYAEVIISRGLLSEEHESRIQDAIDKEKNAENYFDTPDLLGFRIPSSEIHSAVPMKVVGFYDSIGTSVIIAPELMVALHGSDFDVDSLFIIKREEHEGSPVGYQFADGRWSFNKKGDPESPQRLKYLKNTITENLLDVISSQKNKQRMLSPIPLNPLREEVKRVKKKSKGARKETFDLSNINDQMEVHSQIFGADAAIGIFGNASKALSYMLYTGEGRTNPKLRETDTAKKVVIDGVEYNQLTDKDSKGKSIFIDIDGFINASIDNIRELILPALNITSTTINSYIALRFLGVPADVAHNFLQQPVMRAMSKKGRWGSENIMTFLKNKLGTDNIDLTEYPITNENMLKDMAKYEDIFDLENVEITKSLEDFLMRQMAVMNLFGRAQEIGQDITNMSFFLQIARNYPVDKEGIDRQIERKEEIFGKEVNDDGTLADITDFSFDISEFFKERPHIFEAYKALEQFSSTIERSVHKYSRSLTRFIHDATYSTGVRLDSQRAKNRYKIRDEFVHYLLSNYLYTGEYSIPEAPDYVRGDMVLTGARAFNQQFISQVKALKKYFNDKKIDSRFISHLSTYYNPLSKTYELRFSGGTNLDRPDLLDFREAFHQLNQIDFTYHKGPGIYTASLKKKPMADDEFSEFQKAFVTYGIMHNGLSFGATNYSMVLPESLYIEADRLIENLLHTYTAPENKEKLQGLMEHFQVELAINHGKEIPIIKSVRDVRPWPTGSKSDGTFIYSGYDEGIYYDKRFLNTDFAGEVEEGNMTYPKFMHTRNDDNHWVYVRINNAQASVVYYQLVGRVNPFKHYSVDNSVFEKPYKISEAFGVVDPIFGSPIKNIAVRDVNNTSINFEGKEINIGDTITLTTHSDPSRLNKKYVRVKSKKLKSITVEAIEIEDVEPMANRAMDTVDNVALAIITKFRMKASPFWNGPNGKVMMLKHRLGESRAFKNDLNRNDFNRMQVIKERPLSYGVEVYIDRGELFKFLGEADAVQLNLFNKKYLDNEELKDDTIIVSRLAPEDRAVPNEQIEKVAAYFENDSSVTELYNDIIERTKNEGLKKLYSAVRGRVGRADLKLNTLAKLQPGDGARYTLDGTVHVDLENLAAAGYTTVEQIDRVIAHEVVHGITSNAYWSDEKFRDEIDQYFSELINNDIIQQEILKTVVAGDKVSMQGMKSATEMLAEVMVNPEFSELLERIPYPQQENRSWLGRLIDKILVALGIKDANMADRLKTVIVKHTPKVAAFERLGNDKYRDASGKIYQSRGDPMSVDHGEASEDPQAELDKAIMDNSKKYQIELNEDGTEGKFYVKTSTGEKLKRITERASGFISYFLNRSIDPDLSYAEYAADRKWGNIPEDHKLRTDEGNMETKEEYRDRLEERSLVGRVKGSIIHLKLKEFFNEHFRLGYDVNQMRKDMVDLASETDGKVTPEHYDWIKDTKVLEAILYNVGINILQDAPDNVKDPFVMSEITVASDALGFAGTTDLIVRHSDGRYSVIDWKTGGTFNTRYVNDVLKYGNQDILITDTQRDRAKLQMTIYALMLKINHPEMKFRDLQVAWIPGRFQATLEDMDRFVHAPSYLAMLKTFLQDKSALKKHGLPEDVYDQIIKDSPNAFNPSHYSDKVSSELVDNLIDATKRPEQIFNEKVQELNILLGGRENFESLPKAERAKAMVLWKEIATMRIDPSMSLDLTLQHDIGGFVEWFGNYSDVPMGQFQAWNNYRDEQRHKVDKIHNHNFKNLQSLIEPVLKKYLRGRFKVRAFGKYILADIKYQDLYGWAFKDTEIDGYSRERLMLPEDEEYRLLDKEQQDLLNFLNEEFRKFFVGEKAYGNQTATIDSKDKELSVIDLYNRSKNEGEKFKWYPGWFPKVMKTAAEVNYEEGVRALTGKSPSEVSDVFGGHIVGAFTPASIKEKAKRRLTYYVEDEYQMYDDRNMSLPFRYLGSSKIDNARDYTKNLEFMFDAFHKSTVYKKHMDPVYAAGQALKQYLQMQKDGRGQPMFENTVNFLKKGLMRDILGKRMRMKYSRLPLQVGKYNVHVDKIIEMMIGWTSATVMWLRPLQGAGNGLHASLLTWREALKGSIANKFLHIDGELIDMELPDRKWADKIYNTEFLPNVFLGKIRQDKLWLMAEHLQYLPDNFDYATNRRFLLSTRNAINDSSSMYLFHSKWEEYVSLTTMAAQLHHLKNPVTGKSLWDSYEVQQDENTKEYEIHWIGGRRGFQKKGKGDAAVYTDIEGLTANEISKLKKVHERMQGGYRKEEAANAELYVMGKAFIQFKKYLPRLLMNTYHGKRYEVPLGNYRDTGERKDGETVYEWVARMNEGRWRTVVNSIMAVTKFGNPEYKWANLSSEQKQNIVDAIINIGVMAMAYGGYLAFFRDEDDDDTFKKWWYNYLVMNLTQQYNPMDLLHTLESASRPVALARSYKAVTGFTNLLVATANLTVGNEAEAFTQEGHLKGWNEFQRSIPYLASYYDFISKMEHNKSLEPWFVSRFENKWR